MTATGGVGTPLRPGRSWRPPWTRRPSPAPGSRPDAHVRPARRAPPAFLPVAGSASPPGPTHIDRGDVRFVVEVERPAQLQGGGHLVVPGLQLQVPLSRAEGKELLAAQAAPGPRQQQLQQQRPGPRGPAPATRGQHGPELRSRTPALGGPGGGRRGCNRTPLGGPTPGNRGGEPRGDGGPAPSTPHAPAAANGHEGARGDAESGTAPSTLGEQWTLVPAIPKVSQRWAPLSRGEEGAEPVTALCIVPRPG
jgi:hypothetical protein